MGFTTLVQLVLALMPKQDTDTNKIVLPIPYNVCYTETTSWSIDQSCSYEQTDNLDNIISELTKKFSKSILFKDFTHWFYATLDSLSDSHHVEINSNPFPEFKKKTLLSNYTTEGYRVATFNMHIPLEYNPDVEGISYLEYKFRNAARRAWTTLQDELNGNKGIVIDNIEEFEENVEAGIYYYYKGNYKKSKDCFVQAFYELLFLYSDWPGFDEVARTLLTYIFYLDQLRKTEKVKP